MGTKLGIRSLRTGTHDSHARALGSRARTREEARPPSPSYVGAMSDEGDKVLDEITVFLAEKVQKELKQTAKFLDSKKKGLSYNDPERRQINFTQQFAELLARTGVEFLPDDPVRPSIRGTQKGIAEVNEWLVKKGRAPLIPRNH